MTLTLTERYETLSLEAGLQLIAQEFPGQAVFTTSFGLEDQAITHAILSQNLNIRIATLDTGRLFPETYTVWHQTVVKYNAKIEAFYPDAKEIQTFVEKKGPNSIYDSLENRKECCSIRKIIPLDRALIGAKLWITGLRKEQSGFRTETNLFEEDLAKNILKYQPLLHWTWDQTWDYIRKFEIPYNELHDKGFPSIGCAPCTRAIADGEDFRAGRWWWEQESQKECGLHWVDGKLQPKKGNTI
ncbi:phosphoadenylyl-sulfate reductase [Leptospira sp. 96542]|nr:phosphoadenylyl-sulfate reductase [Leptospira sp. 96542]